MSLSISFPLSKPLRLSLSRRGSSRNANINNNSSSIMLPAGGVFFRLSIPRQQLLQQNVATLLIISLFGYVAGITNGVSSVPFNSGVGVSSSSANALNGFISDSVNININNSGNTNANTASHIMANNNNLEYYNNLQSVTTTERQITPPPPPTFLSASSENMQEAEANFNSQSQHLSSQNSFDAVNLRSMQSYPVKNNDVFRPSPIIDFTLSDATASKPQYPPSYLDPVTLKTTQATVQAGAFYHLNYNNINDNNNNNIDNHYASTNTNVNTNTNANVRRSQLKFPNQHSDSVSTVPPQLRTTPILTYRDPYTNQNYHYNEDASSKRPSSHSNFFNTNTQPQRIETYHVYESASNPNYSNNYNNYDYSEQREPQEYTVQSSMFVGVGTNNNNNNGHHISSGVVNSKAIPTRPGYRPGYVVDDVERPNYQQYLQAASTYGNQNNYDKRQQQQQQLQQKYNAFPKPTISTTERLSYDSHDYPPPSYQHLLQREQQKPQHQLRPTPPPPPSATQPPSPATIPPPPYHQQQQQQQQQQRPQQHQQYYQPQRQDVGTYGSAGGNGIRGPSFNAIGHDSASSNYANNFGNYQQQADQYQQQYINNYQRPVRPPPPSQHHPPTFYGPNGVQRPPNNNNNYYEYQLGEIPPPGQHGGPPPFNYQRPQTRPPFQQPQAPVTSSGLASLASLFTTTQQYAPQFTNLLLGAITGGGGGGGGGNGNSYLGNRPSSSSFIGGSSTNKQRPHNMQLIRALENIARNDELECVPKVLCQTIAGQTERGQLPSFITSPAITNFLAGFPASSPALIYGRAALLAISGGEKGCSSTYTKCPKSEYEILYYLNNHRGGFFKFFSEPDDQATAAGLGGHGQSSAGSGAGGSSSAATMAGSLWNILSAFAGNTITASPITTTTPRPRPSRRPAAPSFSSDISSGIGNFFTQMLSDYLSGVEYQRRRRRRRRSTHNYNDDKMNEWNDTTEQETEGRAIKSLRPDVSRSKLAFDLPEDFHDEEDDADTNQGDVRLAKSADDERKKQQFDGVEGRILHKEEFAIDRPKFFPETALSDDTGAAVDQNKGDYDNYGGEDDPEINSEIIKYNAATRQRKLKFPSSTDNNDSDEQQTHFEAIDNSHNEGSHFIHFKDTDDEQEEHDVLAHDSLTSATIRRGKKLVFLESDKGGKKPNFGPNTNNIDSNLRDDKQIVFADSENPGLISSIEISAGTSNRLVFPDHYEKFILRKGRILNRPTYAPTYAYGHTVRFAPDDSTSSDAFVLPNAPHRLRQPHYQQNLDSNYLVNTNYNYLSHHENHEQQSSSYTLNQDAHQYQEQSSSPPQHFLPTVSPNRQQYNYPNTNYISNSQRYSSDSNNNNNNSNNNNKYYNSNYSKYQATSNAYRRTTRRPVTSPPKKHEDDKNIYITNGHGVTEYYLTPDGRKIYL